jgi:hypothetical protein
MAEKDYKYEFTIDGKKHNVSKSNIDKYGWSRYAEDYPNATVRVRDNDKNDYDIPIGRMKEALGRGWHPFTIDATPKPSMQPTTTAAAQTMAAQPATSAKPMMKSQMVTEQDTTTPTGKSANEMRPTTPLQKNTLPPQGDTQQPTKLQAQAAKREGKPDRIVRLRRGGKDFEVLQSEINHNGDLAAWAKTKGAGAPIRVYMRDTEGKLYHVNVSKAMNLIKDGWTVESREDNGHRYTPTSSQTADLSKTFKKNIQTQQQLNAAADRAENMRQYQELSHGRDRAVSTGLKYDAASGQVKREYLTASGERTFSREAAEAENRAFHQGDAAMKAKADAAIDQAWNKAVKADANPTQTYATSHGDLVNSLISSAEHNKNFDMDRLTNEAYHAMPQEYRDNTIAQYTQYFEENPDECNGMSPYAAAVTAMKGEIYKDMYNRAVKANVPKNKLEYFAAKMMENYGWVLDAAARGMSGSSGDQLAREQALSEYGSKHRWLATTASIASMATDPMLWATGGLGGAATRGMINFMGKRTLQEATKSAAARYAMSRVGSRMFASAVGGAANLGAYDAAKNIETQISHGGVLKDDGTIGSYSVGDALSKSMHGVVLGGVTGALAPLWGNATDAVVDGIGSTTGKVATRAAAAAGSGLLDGTIFATADYLTLSSDEKKKTSFGDVWGDNIIFMLGLKTQGAIKSAGHVVKELVQRGEPLSTVIRRNAQSVPQVRLSKDDIAELDEHGYSDLSELFKFDKDASAHVKDGRLTGYAEMQKLMEDTEVSQAVRAKAYYIATGGHMLSPGTIAKCTTTSSDNGKKWTVQSRTADNEVVTSREFATEDEARAEEAKVKHQVELNSINVGEQKFNQRNAYDASKKAIADLAKEVNVDEEKLSGDIKDIQMAQAGNLDVELSKSRLLDRYNEILSRYSDEATNQRNEISKKYGIDLNETIAKNEGERSDVEKEALYEYMNVLYPERETVQKANEQAEASYNEGAEAHKAYEQGDTSAAEQMAANAANMRECIERVKADLGERALSEIDEDPIGYLTLCLTISTHVSVWKALLTPATKALRTNASRCKRHL